MGNSRAWRSKLLWFYTSNYSQLTPIWWLFLFTEIVQVRLVYINERIAPGHLMRHLPRWSFMRILSPSNCCVKINKHFHFGGGSGPVTVAQCSIQPAVSVNCKDGKKVVFHTLGGNRWWQWHIKGSAVVWSWRHGNQHLRRRGLSMKESHMEQPTSISVSNSLGLGTTSGTCARRLEQ